MAYDGGLSKIADPSRQTLPNGSHLAHKPQRGNGLREWYQQSLCGVKKVCTTIVCNCAKQQNQPQRASQLRPTRNLSVGHGRHGQQTACVVFADTEPFGPNRIDMCCTHPPC